MKKYIRNEETISGKLHDEQVVLDIEKSKYFSLNPVATRIWEILEQAFELDELIRLLMEEYDVELDQCTVETKAYLDEMVKLRLVRDDSA